MKEGLPSPIEIINKETAFGRILSRARNVSAPKSLREISEKCGSSSEAIHNWEMGRTFPPENKLKAIAEAYEVKLDDLINAFELSKDTKNIIKRNRRSLSQVEKPKKEDIFSGRIESLEIKEPNEKDIIRELSKKKDII